MKSVRSPMAFGLILALSSSSVFAQATATLPAAKEVIAKYVEATGGADALKSVKNRVVKGKMMFKEAGIGGAITTVSARGGKTYTAVDIAGVGTEKQGSDGTTYWSQSQFTGDRILEGQEREQLLKDNDFESDLHPEKYYTAMKVSGVEKVGNEECYRVEKTKKSGGQQVDFYSLESGLMLRSLNTIHTPQGELPTDSTMSDYRTVGDLVVSFKTEVKLTTVNMTQVVTIESVDLNTEIEDSKFALPEEIQKLKDKAATK